MLIPMILTGLAGLALGIAIMRLVQARGQDASSAATSSEARQAVDSGAAPKEPKAGLVSPRLAFAGAGALVLAAGGIYAYRSLEGPAETPLALPAGAAAVGQPDAKLDDVDTMISRLEARLQKNPNDGEGFRMLGWSFQSTGKPAEAALACPSSKQLAQFAA